MYKRQELTDLREKLLNFTSMIELELDFSEEDVEFADRSVLLQLADSIEKVIARLVHSFNVGNVIKNGVPVGQDFIASVEKYEADVTSKR